MKLKDVEIIVMNDEEYGDHLKKLFEKVKEGKINESEPHKIVSCTTEDIGKILTRERIRLEKKPESISELARILDRKESNVHNDLTFLEGIGLLEIKKGRNNVLRKSPLLIMMHYILQFLWLHNLFSFLILF